MNWTVFYMALLGQLLFQTNALAQESTTLGIHTFSYHNNGNYNDNKTSKTSKTAHMLFLTLNLQGLLQKNAEEKKSGAGQYFTPRPLIDSMVAVMQPTIEDVIQDPAAGTGGFPIAALHSRARAIESGTEAGYESPVNIIL